MRVSNATATTMAIGVVAVVVVKLFLLLCEGFVTAPSKIHESHMILCSPCVHFQKSCSRPMFFFVYTEPKPEHQETLQRNSEHNEGN